MGKLDEAVKIIGWRSRRRAGVRMNAVCYIVLEYLLANKRDGIPFAPVDVHGNTLNTLIEQDWIVASPGIDGQTLYKITSRGEQAFRLFAAPPAKRTDGICPACGERPKARYPGGGKVGYCDECRREYDRRKNARKRKLPGWQRAHILQAVPERDTGGTAKTAARGDGGTHPLR